MRVFFIYNAVLYIIFTGYFVSGRTLMRHLYSKEEHNLLKSGRMKRAFEVDANYCVQTGCCQSRNDDCSVPYVQKNSTCYCDRFCDQEPIGHVDCCPDFWLLCNDMNLQNPPTKPTSVSQTLHKKGKCGSFEIIYLFTCIDAQWVCTQRICLVQMDLIEDINSEEYGWKADNHSDFWGMTLIEGFEYRLGTSAPSRALLGMNEMTGHASLGEEFPLFFIASYKWPQYIHGPLDQKNCAASWAFSTASVAADRIAIHSQGLVTENLSPQHLISCDSKNLNGCNGGTIDSAWWFLRKRGLVSHSCYPFTMDANDVYVPCNMSSIMDERGKAHATSSCPNTLEDSNYVYQCSPPYRVPSDEKEIMKEIMENGPVQAVMTVHEDFFLYKTGIYTHTDVAESKSERHKMKASATAWASKIFCTLLFIRALSSVVNIVNINC
uniref:Tubulointerstitial nephritis antigen n=1 Tax=Leptobrachium leishanense TaxID=445787 RepID=A0A8C5MFE0_9ANUR